MRQSCGNCGTSKRESRSYAPGLAVFLCPKCDSPAKKLTLAKLGFNIPGVED